MPSNKKLFVHNTLVELCFRTEEGLPFPPNPLIIFILHSIIARAQTFYPVTICHCLVMSNHIHMLVIVRDPQHVSDFVGYIKKESAHAVNRLLGRTKHTVWAAGFDSPTILDPATAIHRITYLYTNPHRPNLVDSIDQYPHFSSWDAFSQNSDKIISVTRVNRDSLLPLPQHPLSIEEFQQIISSLKSKDDTIYELKLEPNAWMLCFSETRDKNPQAVNNEILKLIRAEEELARISRTSEVLGSDALIAEPMTKPHIPKKHGKRMLCLSIYKQLRCAFVRWARDYCSTFHGLFMPGGHVPFNINPCFVPSIDNYSFG